jgi:hypothetical protein
MMESCAGTADEKRTATTIRTAHRRDAEKKELPLGLSEIGLKIHLSGPDYVPAEIQDLGGPERVRRCFAGVN